MCNFWHHRWLCPRCVLDRSVYQSTQWTVTVANVAHLICHKVDTPTCDVRSGTFSKRLVMANHTHSWWYNMSPLTKQRWVEWPCGDCCGSAMADSSHGGRGQVDLHHTTEEVHSRNTYSRLIRVWKVCHKRCLSRAVVVQRDSATGRMSWGDRMNARPLMGSAP